jgi:hypothetical protein
MELFGLKNYTSWCKCLSILFFFMILEIKSMGGRKLTYEGLVGVIRRICMQYTRSYEFLWNDLG